MNEYVCDRWHALVAKYNSDKELAASTWLELVKAYSGRKRYYHNLQHIAALLAVSDVHAAQLVDKDIVDFAICYHDYVYDVPGPQNEHRSAEFAGKRLADLHIPADMIEQVKLYIEATKKHEPVAVTHASDLLYFLDFDMAILGSPWQEYADYLAAIRKEYKWYPDLLYYPRRKTFLQQTLAGHVFHTEFFKKELEGRARENMRRELSGS